MTAPLVVEPALAIVPARGGSKRIPRKNIRSFLGVPLLARTIGILRASGVFSRIVVSTDDQDIAAIARDAGAEVPFMRPASLADDFTPTIPVVVHAIDEVEGQGQMFGLICCVYPAAVLSRPDDFREAARTLSIGDSDYVFAATSFPYPIQRALRRTDAGCEMLWPEHRQTRSQDLEPAYHDAGQFYFGRREAWLEHRPFFSPRSRMHLMPGHRVQDIDTLEDWQRAELLFQTIAGQDR